MCRLSSPPVEVFSRVRGGQKPTLHPKPTATTYKHLVSKLPKVMSKFLTLATDLLHFAFHAPHTHAVPHTTLWWPKKLQ